MAREGLQRSAAYAENVSRRKYRTRLQLLATPVLTGVEGVEFGGFTLVAEGGDEPYVYFVHKGALPDGLTLDPATGVVSGTPTAAGVFEGIELAVEDSVGRVVGLPAFTITVSEA